MFKSDFQTAEDVRELNAQEMNLQKQNALKPAVRAGSAAAGTDVKKMLRAILRDEAGRKAAIAFTEILGEPVCKRRQGMNRCR